MPIDLPPGLRRLGEWEFKQVAYEVMHWVFTVHHDLGCLFDEPLYQGAVAQRLPDAQREVPLGVRFESFKKTYYLDLLISHGAVFEFKAAEALVDRHRAQLLNYLLLMELPHGKLVNFRGAKVEHEFVNATLTHRDRTAFRVETTGYAEVEKGFSLRECMVAILRDWGTCLDTALYQEALVHFLRGQDRIVRPVDIHSGEVVVGRQKMNLISPETSACITTLNDGQSVHEAHLRRLLKHTRLKNIQWVNIGRKVVTFKTIKA